MNGIAMADQFFKKKGGGGGGSYEIFKISEFGLSFTFTKRKKTGPERERRAPSKSATNKDPLHVVHWVFV